MILYMALSNLLLLPNIRCGNLSLLISIYLYLMWCFHTSVGIRITWEIEKNTKAQVLFYCNKPGSICSLLQVLCKWFWYMYQSPFSFSWTYSFLTPSFPPYIFLSSFSHVAVLTILILSIEVLPSEVVLLI